MRRVYQRCYWSPFKSVIVSWQLCKIPRSTLWPIHPLPHLKYLQHCSVQQLLTDKHLPATNQMVNISCVPDTVDRLYIDLYLAVSLMYIIRARKALYDSSSRPPHPLHFLLCSSSLAPFLALAACSSLITVCLYPPLITRNYFQSGKSSVPQTLTNRLVRRIIQLYKLEMIQVAVVIQLLARFGSCWQDWMYLGGDQYNSVTGFYTMDTIEYCEQSFTWPLPAIYLSVTMADGAWMGRTSQNLALHRNLLPKIYLLPAKSQLY